MAAAALKRTEERRATAANGGLMLLITFIVLALMAWSLVDLISHEEVGMVIILSSLTLVLVLLLSGYYSLQPNEAAVITLFGNYEGTDRTSGLRWVLPWYKRTKISLRVRNVTGEKLKVNDKRGNPIEIAAVVVWRSPTPPGRCSMSTSIRVSSTFRSKPRCAKSHRISPTTTPSMKNRRCAPTPMKWRNCCAKSFRTAPASPASSSTKPSSSHLAYAPEIAGAMLRRQQAEAVIAARTLIVEGAVSMVENALQQLSARDIVKLDDERRAAMVSNLLVVLCGDRDTQPVVNAGTIYQ